MALCNQVKREDEMLAIQQHYTIIDCDRRCYYVIISQIHTSILWFDVWTPP